MQPTTLAKKNWTVLFYGGGANDLQPSVRKAWQQLQGSELPPNVDTFVEHFDSEGHSQEVHFEGAGQQELLPRSEAPVNSGAGETFEKFLLRGMKRFPAAHYLVVVSSHGSGAGGVVTDDVAGDGLSLQEFGRAMESARENNGGRTIDMVMFDACQMGAAEMALELEGKAQVMVASLDNVGNSGYHLPTLLHQASRAHDAKELANLVVANSDPQQERTFRTLSAVELSDMKPFRTAYREWSEELAGLDAGDLSLVRETLAEARRNLNAPETQATYDSIAEDLLSQYPVDVGGTTRQPATDDFESAIGRGRWSSSHCSQRSAFGAPKCRWRGRSHLSRSHRKFGRATLQARGRAPAWYRRDGMGEGV